MSTAKLERAWMTRKRPQERLKAACRIKILRLSARSLSIDSAETIEVDLIESGKKRDLDIGFGLPFNPSKLRRVSRAFRVALVTRSSHEGKGRREEIGVGFSPCSVNFSCQLLPLILKPSRITPAAIHAARTFDTSSGHASLHGASSLSSASSTCSLARAHLRLG